MGTNEGRLGVEEEVGERNWFGVILVAADV